MKYKEAIAFLEPLSEYRKKNGPYNTLISNKELKAIDVAIEAMYRLISLED